MSITEIEVIKNLVQQEQVSVPTFSRQKRSSLKEFIDQENKERFNTSIASEGGFKSRSGSIVSEQKTYRIKLDAKKQNLYFQTVQIQWNAFLKLLRRQLMDSFKKKTLLFDTELMGKFIIQNEKLTFVNNNCFNVICGKNTSNDSNIVLDQATHVLNLQPLATELDVNIDEIKQNIKAFITSLNELLKKSTKNLRLDIKIGVFVTKNSDSAEKELEFKFSPNFFNKQQFQNLIKDNEPKIYESFNSFGKNTYAQNSDTLSVISHQILQPPSAVKIRVEPTKPKPNQDYIYSSSEYLDTYGKGFKKYHHLTSENIQQVLNETRRKNSMVIQPILGKPQAETQVNMAEPQVSKHNSTNSLQIEIQDEINIERPSIIQVKQIECSPKKQNENEEPFQFIKAQVTDKPKQNQSVISMSDFLSENLTNIEQQMNQSNKRNYRQMKKTNENTRTTMVYTSDLPKRPKSQLNEIANSSSRHQESHNFSNYIDQDTTLREKLTQKRATLKSQQQNSRYEKKHRGTFAWDLNEPRSAASTIRKTRNFKNLDENIEFLIRSQNIKNNYDNQKTVMSLRENFSDVLEHKHIEYTNGKVFEHNKNDKYSTNTAQMAMKRHSTGNQELFKPVLTNSFKVHPLEALDVQRYTKKDLATEMLQKRQEQQIQEKVEVKIPTPKQISVHHQEILPWEKRRNPLLGVQYSESVNNIKSSILESFPEKDIKLMPQNVQRDHMNSSNVFESQINNFNKMLLKKQQQKNIDDENYQKKLKLIQYKIRQEKVEKREKCNQNQKFLAMQIAQNEKKQKIVRLKSREPGQMCAITGTKEFDENQILQTKYFIEKNRKFTNELNKFLNLTQTRIQLDLQKEKEQDSLLIEHNKRINQVEDYNKKQRRQLIQSMNRNTWKQQIEVNQRKMYLGNNYIF